MTAQKPTILVADDDPRLLRLTQYALEQQNYRVLLANNGQELLDTVQRELPDLIVTDMMMPVLDGQEALHRLRQDPRTQRIPVIFMTAQGEIDDKVRAFEAGADDYVVKPVNMAELTARIKALLTRVRATAPAAPPPPKGLIFCPFSLRGGVGVSSLAVNLAVSLAQLWQVEVPLVDMALEAGQAALFLDLRPKSTWADLAGCALEELDLSLLQSCLTPHPSQVRVLAAPPEPQAADAITAPLVTKVLGLLRDNYPFVALDMPSHFSPATLVALDLADHVLLMLAPEIASVQAATKALDVFSLLGYPAERVIPVLNALFPGEGLLRKDIEAALGISIRAGIPYAKGLLVTAINKGIPIVLGAPTSPTAMVIQQMAYHLSPPERQKTPPAQPSEMWQRVRKALRQ